MKQAIAQSISNTETFGIETLQSLTQEKSYTTRETVLLQSWIGLREQNKGQELKKILDEMDGQFGFSDGNIRTLWLTLSLATADYKPNTANERYKELIGYTDPSRPFQLRENAFRYLFQIQSFEEESLKNLLEASVHHIWRFRESAREILKRLLEDDVIKEEVKSLQTKLPEKQQAYLSKVFKLD